MCVLKDSAESKESFYVNVCSYLSLSLSSVEACIDDEPHFGKMPMDE